METQPLNRRCFFETSHNAFAPKDFTADKNGIIHTMDNLMFIKDNAATNLNTERHQGPII